MNPRRVDFGKWLKCKREISGLSQSDVAKHLHLPSKSPISQWEGAFSAIPIEKLFDLAELYGIDMKEVIQKLNETEPVIAERFNGLSLRFAKYHLDLMSGNRPGEIRQHHRNFCLQYYILSE